MKFYKIIIILSAALIITSCSDTELNKQNDDKIIPIEKDSLMLLKKENESQKTKLQNEIDSLKKELEKQDSIMR